MPKNWHLKGLLTICSPCIIFPILLSLHSYLLFLTFRFIFSFFASLTNAYSCQGFNSGHVLPPNVCFDRAAKDNIRCACEVPFGYLPRKCRGDDRQVARNFRMTASLLSLEFASEDDHQHRTQAQEFHSKLFLRPTSFIARLRRL